MRVTGPVRIGDAGDVAGSGGDDYGAPTNILTYIFQLIASS